MTNIISKLPSFILTLKLNTLNINTILKLLGAFTSFRVNDELVGAADSLLKTIKDNNPNAVVGDIIGDPQFLEFLGAIIDMKQKEQEVEEKTALCADTLTLCPRCGAAQKLQEIIPKYKWNKERK